MRTTHALAFLVLLIGACTPPPPAPPVITLTQTADTLIVPVVQVSHAAALSGNRWALLALQEGEVRLADFDTRKVTGFPGITKAEVTYPTVLFGVGDTVLIGDFALRRVTRWTVGKPRLEAIPISDALRGALPRAHDAAGNWYFQMAPRGGPNSSGILDSAVIVRGDAMLTRFDTVARLAPPDMAALDDASGRTYVRRALSGEDHWGVFSDGTLWIARTYQNRIDWFPVGAKKPTFGKSLPDPILELSQMDKEIFIRRYPADQQENARLSTPWSPIKPPFESVFAAADGRMWLFKSAPALDSIRKFQVVDETGVRVIVAVPSRGIALGLSADAILMAEEFPGGIRLLRYPIPKEAIAR